MIQAMIESFSNWLGTTAASGFVMQHAWVWPAAETLHFVGLSMLIGTIGAIDLRLLGLAKRVPFAPLHRLLPWGISGFGICLGTGIVFFTGQSSQYINNWVFWCKMLFVVLAGANVAIFYVTGIFQAAEDLQAGDDAPLAAKAVALASLVLWLGVLYLGRMLPFLGDAF
jgi:uncharacterized membrane protein